MKIGLIADIHGNLFALRKVINALDLKGVERIWCLGDLATPGPWPVEVLELLEERGIPSVMGNTDEWMLAEPDTAVSDSPEMNAISHWAASRLDAAARAAMADLPMSRLETIPGDVAALLVHGSTRSTEDVISEHTPGIEIVQMLADAGAIVGLGGHTHVQMFRNLGIMMMVNPGSVGLGGTGPGTWDLPPTAPVSVADFAVLDVGDGAIDVEFYHIELDIAAMLKAAELTGMPHFGWWASLWKR